MIRPTKNIPETSDIEIVSTQKTKTVSGKSDLTYHLGKDDDSNAYIRTLPRCWKNRAARRSPHSCFKSSLKENR
jgi:hypothetical protein